MLGKDESKILNQGDSAGDRYAVKARLNLNDLLRRKTEQKKLDRKTNLTILLSVGTLALVVILILNL